jgi:hypothetical protein
MASEPFEATDDNGNTVTGTVEVFRHPKGPYFDPTHPYFRHPRYADAHFEYFDTRAACTIDPKVLSEAMQQAFSEALRKFGIPDADGSAVKQDVDKSIEATRQQCARNADKYVSNETFSSTNWDTGKAVGNLTAKAYEAVSTPGGRIQTVVARENSWPADDVPALKNNDGTNVRILSRRVVTRDDGGSGVGNSTEGFDPMIATQPAPRPQTGGTPVRRLVSNTDTSPAMPVVSFDIRSSLGEFFGNQVSSPDATTPRNPNVPVSSPEAEGPIGLVSGKPMRFFQAPIFNTRNNSNAASGQNWFTTLGGLSRDGGKPQASAIDAGTPGVPFVSDRQNIFGNGRGAASPASDPGDAFAPPMSTPQNPQGPLSLMDAYLQYRKRLDANQSQASAANAGMPAATLAPSDDSNFSGGLLGRLAALMGVDPQNPDQLAPLPQDDELRAFYRDNPAQPWTLQRWR